MSVPADDPFRCPACHRSLPAAEACPHLRGHEDELSRQTMAGDTLGAAEAHRQLLRAIQAHVKMRERGNCVCASEGPRPPEL